MKSRSLLAAALILIAALAAYWYWSPFLAVRQLQTAAQEGDAEAFNAHVDYPKVRESLKGQFSVLVTKKLGTQDSSNPFAALGSLIGLGLVNQLVDAMVRPETVMAAMKNGHLAKPAPTPTPARQPEGGAPPAGEATPPSSGPAPEKKARWIIDRQGANKMIAYAVDPARPDEPNSERLGLVFERSGFVDWKLTELRMPASAFDK
ncbi:DUF2939 domain-containing protein [Variovorax sp. J2P1-59]|uniref:DUF2939 domain-containing protein n=1 Tax=Variovorax flavidus TaxID=3053501 RepID=UPI00257570F1|nr:DUF2939 domain-containing protein [Variovorax sp. J2P1-59]MDM0073205.1 DUF2939 domain-containing protein [Variovorax sp. J2P1-59]